MTSWKETLRLQNALLSRSILIGEDGAVATSSLKSLRTDKEFIFGRADMPLSAEFSILWRDTWLQGHRPGQPQDFIVLRNSLRTEQPGIQQLELFLSDPDGNLQVEVHYEIYEDHPLVRKWISITNTSPTPGVLKQVAWEDLSIAAGSPSELEIGRGVEPLRPESRWVPSLGERLLILYDCRGKQALVALNEELGQVACIEVNDDQQPHLKICYSRAFGGITLEPNETFRTVPSALLLADQRSADQCIESIIPEYIRNILSRPIVEPRIVYCTADAVKAESRTLRLMPDAHFASAIGFTTLCVEGGGFARAGGFDVDPQAIPGGLGHAARLLDERQMELGVTIPLAALDPYCEVAQEHPEWLCTDEAGRPASTIVDGQQRLIACLASGYSDYLLNGIRTLYERDKVRLVHLVGGALSMPAGTLAPCHTAGHEHAGPADAALVVGRRLELLLRQITEDCPEMAVGVDHDVLGDVAGVDSALLAAADFIRICRVPETLDRRTHLEARRILYRHALRFPSERLALGILRVDGRNPVATVATAIGCYPLFAGSAGRLASGQLDWMRGILDWYYSLTRGISFHERFYLLHGNDDARSMYWDGYARLSKRGEGFAAVFRNKAPSPLVRFPIPGLEPGARYRLDSIVRDRSLGIFQATDLAEGFPFELTHEDGADLIEIRRVDP